MQLCLWRPPRSPSFCSCSSRHALRKFHQRQEGLQSHKAFHLSSLYFSLIAFICLSDILSRLYSEKKKKKKSNGEKVSIRNELGKKQTKKKNQLLHILNPSEADVRVSEHFALISVPEGNVSFFFDQGCFSYCPSVAMKKSLRVPCRKSKVGRSSGFCFQHVVMISCSSSGQLSGRGIR